MMGSRRGRPSLIGRAAGTAARTAVIAKTATAVTSSSAAKHQARAHEAELAHAQRMAAVGGGGSAEAVPAAPTSGLTQEKIDQLKQLAELRAAGVLSDVEFEVQKAKLLA
jgi:hypothetical protein